jgi:hypothetical protein
MRVLLLVALVLTVSSCGVLPQLSGGIHEKQVKDGIEVCKEKGGLHMVNVSLTGFSAFCKGTGTKAYSI